MLREVVSDRYERCERLMSPTPHSLSMSAPLIALKTTPRRLALVSRPPVLTLTKDGPHSPTRAVLYYLCVSGSLRTNKDAAGSHGLHPPPLPLYSPALPPPPHVDVSSRWDLRKVSKASRFTAGCGGTTEDGDEEEVEDGMKEMH